MDPNPKWLQWGIALQAIAQNGLVHTSNPFDRDRYEQLREIATDMMATFTDVDPDIIRGLFAQEVGYATPKVDVRGVVFQNQQILLVKEKLDGCWSLPGGWADVNETPSTAVEREIYEESGYLARAVKVLAVYDRSRHPHYPPMPYHVYKIFFLCELTGGSATPSIETDDSGFFSEHHLPPLSMPRVTPQQIARFFEHARNPDWATDFD